jgi:hypothetical protein
MGVRPETARTLDPEPPLNDRESGSGPVIPISAEYGIANQRFRGFVSEQTE